MFVRSATAAAAQGVPSRAQVEALGEEALAVGLYCAMSARRFEECIGVAANHDGDSDSTASIAGQLWGARYGLGELPAEVVERIDVLEALLGVWGEWEDRGSGRA